ncbi:WecB/TagA/CpsF family glycosyltransferase [Desulfoscipio geothermicus]|uniref:N-acetylglucosaminyldiphosphoundecaprenol N-acetyl-beta-D-mannosaminyltransferase n=1 Tax=Desulfoscipio geothermicus DSM 3669 TaxID=1121426 RepID=A0A1I6DE90_9FIRM|nr:WecB/TagA/CpsF family glycosyltransferase [Desulfoscipio geothermicus]SFR03756.1 N-acetylglucosaminyldiphosphoundecaprenol N-acetyl-beta-D-mannosaminyltransferase [Desulfoscipio geothermicus DSM 3669]
MKVTLLKAPVDRLTMAQAEERVAELVRGGGARRIITLNPEYLYRAVLGEPDLLELVHKADLVTADGEGIVWAGRVAGTPFPERVTGIDLMLRLVRRAAAEGWKVYLLGAAPGVAEEAAENLRRRHPGLQVAGTHHGYFKPDEEQRIVEDIKKTAPQLLFVALGAPAQEKWIDRNIERIGNVTAMGVGGSFDVIAGRVTRAPRWMQRLKIEWLGRLIREPSRWRRMLVLPKFAWLVLKTYRGAGC